MEDYYLTKFETLSQELKDKISTPEAIKALEEIELKYNIPLARIVVGVVIKDIKLEDLENVLQRDLKIEKEVSLEIKNELIQSLFKPILGYLKGEEIDEAGEEKKSSSSEAAEDKEEIEKLKEKVKEIKPISIDDLTQEIIKKSNLSFEDENLNKRFKNIVSAHLKDIRDKMETKEVLMKAKKVGGLGLENEEAERVVKIIEQEFKKLDEGLKKEVKLPEFEVSKAVKPVTVEQIKSSEPVKPVEPPAPPKPKLEVTPSKPVPLPAKEVKPMIEKKESSKPIKVPYMNYTRDWTGKPKIQDIKPPPPKVMGPLEELKYFNLKDFRNLSDNCLQITSIIKQKIDLLEKESFAKKIQGIKNWRQSEVYKLYLEIGRESIEKNKETSQIIQGRTAQGKPALSEEEFEAIVDLNKSLRF